MASKSEEVQPDQTVNVEVDEAGQAEEEEELPPAPVKPSFWGRYEIPIKWVFTLIGLIYTILCNVFTPQISRPIIGFFVFAFYLFLWGKYIKPAAIYQSFKEKQEGAFHSIGEKVATINAWKYGAIALCTLITAALSIGLILAPTNYPERAIIRDSEKGREWAYRLQGLFGNVVWVAIGYAVSRRRKDINWRLVWTGVMLQFVFALLVLRTQAGFDLFDLFANLATTLIGYSSEGVKFLVNEVPGNFLGSVPATIIFFSALISVLYFWGIMTKVIWFLAKVIRWVMGEGVSGREAICAAANIFVGQTEAPLLIKPLLPYMTGSEIHTVMTAGFATIAGGVFFAYVRLGVDPRALLTASVISAPASIVISKLFLPEVPKSELPESVKDEKDAAKDKALDYKPEFGEEVNFMHAAANGATQGMMLALNVIGSLIAVLGLFYTADGIFTFICRSLDPTGSLPEGFGLITVFSYIGYPIAWLMGVPNEDLLIVGQVVSQKTILNEFVAYLSLSDLIKAKTISYRAEIIATYALCGFSNIASIGIQIGGIGGIAPTRKGEIASLAFSAMIAGSIACFMTASIAGMLI